MVDVNANLFSFHILPYPYISHFFYIPPPPGAGRDILTKISTGGDEAEVDPRTHNVAYEARQMKKLFLRLFDG